MAVDLIEVRLWGQTVGAVALEPSAGCYVFEYDPAWRRMGIEIAPLTMPLRGRSARYLFPALGRETFKGLPGALADALPDAFGNALIDAEMARRGIDPAAITTLDRLAYMGRRGMGALEFEPAQGSGAKGAAPLVLRELVEAARLVVSGHLHDRDAGDALRSIIQVGTSAGGARAKAVVAWHPDSNELRSGQFDAPDGFEHWLLKFDGVGKDLELGSGAHYGRIEYAYHRMAVAAGIDMARCRLLEEGGRAHFMTRRFDREGNTRHHMQTLCAMAHLDYNLREANAYEQLFQTADALELDDNARAQLFRRMAFNVMARNCDDHTKNFAFLLRRGGTWELAPAYDVTHAYNPKGIWTYQHLMSVNGKFDAIGRSDLMQVAKRFDVPDPRALLGQVRDAVERWQEFATEAGLSEADAATIATDHVLLQAR